MCAPFWIVLTRGPDEHVASGNCSSCCKWCSTAALERGFDATLLLAAATRQMSVFITEEERNKSDTAFRFVMQDIIRSLAGLFNDDTDALKSCGMFLKRGGMKAHVCKAITGVNLHFRALSAREVEETKISRLLQLPAEDIRPSHDFPSPLLAPTRCSRRWCLVVSAVPLLFDGSSEERPAQR